MDCQPLKKSVDEIRNKNTKKEEYLNISYTKDQYSEAVSRLYLHFANLKIDGAGARSRHRTQALNPGARSRHEAKAETRDNETRHEAKAQGRDTWPGRSPSTRSGLETRARGYEVHLGTDLGTATCVASIASGVQQRPRAQARHGQKLRRMDMRRGAHRLAAAHLHFG